MLTGSQVRMARGYLQWSLAELARRANVGISTLQRIEKEDGSPLTDDDLQWRTDARAAVVEAVEKALVAAGITLLDDDGRGYGVRGKVKTRGRS